MFIFTPGFLIDVSALIWVLFILITSCHWNIREMIRGNFCGSTATKTFHNLLISVTVSPLLCSANHLPYVALSYVSDPYHAGSVTMGYFITFLLFYFMFGQFYSFLALRIASKSKDISLSANVDIVNVADGDVDRRKVRAPFNTQVVSLSLSMCGGKGLRCMVMCNNNYVFKFCLISCNVRV